MSEAAEVETVETTDTWLRAELGARASYLAPDLGIARAFTLPRARLEGAAERGDAGVHIVVAAVRSGGETGYVGINGEALVPEIQTAEGTVRAFSRAFEGSAGLVSDDWTRTGDAAWGLRALAPSLGEDLGWMDVADLGGKVAWSTSGLAASVSATTGEGARFRERNEGKDLTAYLEARPLRGASTLVVSGLVRNGSRGLGLARDHRVGLRVSGGGPHWRGGAEGLAAWGVAGDATREPRAMSGWLTARVLDGWIAWGRLDAAAEDLSDATTATVATRLGFGHDLGESARIVAGGVNRSVGTAVRGVAGAEALGVSTEVFVQLDLWVDTRDGTSSSQGGHLGAATGR